MCIGIALVIVLIRDVALAQLNLGLPSFICNGLQLHGSSSSHNNGMEGVVDSKSAKCM